MLCVWCKRLRPGYAQTMESEGETMIVQRECPICHNVFTPKRSNQKYCSSGCRRYREKHIDVKHAEPGLGVPIIREFRCRQCAKLIRIADPDDKRHVFCSVQCEREYWRHSYYRKDHGRGGNLGMSGGMSLGGLIRRERRDLD